jgi:hypothetical protein
VQLGAEQEARVSVGWEVHSLSFTVVFPCRSDTFMYASIIISSQKVDKTHPITTGSPSGTSFSVIVKVNKAKTDKKK